MRFDTLEQWLDWQMALHDKAIDLGLERVQLVAANLGLGKLAHKVITVAGTNGKGSTVAAYENWLYRAGNSVASYTSPHILRYNERIKYNLEPVGDDELCHAFEAVEAARRDTALTYFEFGTLAALWLIHRWQPDYAILEVGLGGRLDAVNIIDADLVHITAIGIDHQAWLGDNREKIGFEKAGVLRRERPVILNDPDPPQSVLAEIERLDCPCQQLFRDFRITDRDGDGLLWESGQTCYPLEPVLPGAHQIMNLAGVVAGLSTMGCLDCYQPQEIRDFFRGTRIAGRFQQLESQLSARLFVDVGHNADAARALAASLADVRQPSGRLIVLLGMLEDKQADTFTAILDPVVDEWWLLSLDCDRGQTAAQLQTRIGPGIDIEHRFDNVDAALDHALSSLGNQDIMLATGSFVTVELLLRALPDSGELDIYGSKH